MKLMKFFLGIVFFMMLSVQSKADTYTDSLWIKANDAYSMSEYSQALSLYDKIIETGVESASLYYNIGNCYFKLGEKGKAILFFEKALKINPSNKDIQTNLSLAKMQTLDKINVVPEFILKTFIKDFRDILNSDKWGWMSLFFLALTVFLILVFKFALSGRCRKVGFVLAVISMLSFISSLAFALSLRVNGLNSEYAIVSPPVCNVKSAPNIDGNNLFILHEGTKIQILEQMGGWSKIELTDGRQGWTEQKDYELI